MFPKKALALDVELSKRGQDVLDYLTFQGCILPDGPVKYTLTQRTFRPIWFSLLKEQTRFSQLDSAVIPAFKKVCDSEYEEEDKGIGLTSLLTEAHRYVDKWRANDGKNIHFENECYHQLFSGNKQRLFETTFEQKQQNKVSEILQARSLGPVRYMSFQRVATLPTYIITHTHDIVAGFELALQFTCEDTKGKTSIFAGDILSTNTTDGQLYMCPALFNLKIRGFFVTEVQTLWVSCYPSQYSSEDNAPLIFLCYNLADGSLIQRYRTDSGQDARYHRTSNHVFLIPYTPPVIHTFNVRTGELTSSLLMVCSHKIQKMCELPFGDIGCVTDDDEIWVYGHGIQKALFLAGTLSVNKSVVWKASNRPLYEPHLLRLVLAYAFPASKK